MRYLQGIIRNQGCKTICPPRIRQRSRHLRHRLWYVLLHNGLENSSPDFALEVWRTQQAINRSSNKSSTDESPLSSTVYSHTDRSFTKKTESLPRGHLGFYRKISPPTPCIAFRARVDNEDVEGKERALLATAGEEAVYVWDLDDEGSLETIRIDLTGDRIQASHPNLREISLLTSSVHRV